MKTTTKKGVMAASIKELKIIINKYLRLFDDLQQDGPKEEDLDYFDQTFVKAYHDTEPFLTTVNKTGDLSDVGRNHLRMTLKHYTNLIPNDYIFVT